MSETLLAEVLRAFSQALKQDVAPDTDFFANGGDSLAAAAVLTDLSQVTGQEIAGWMLLDYPTPATLAAALAG